MDPNNNQTPQPSTPIPGQEPPAAPTPVTPPVSDVPAEGVTSPTTPAPTEPSTVPPTPTPPAPGVTPPTSGPGTVTNAFGSPAMPMTDDGMPPAGMGGMSPAPKKKMNIMMIAIIAAVAVLVLAVASYFLFFKNSNKSADKAAQQSSHSSTVKATDMATLNHVTLKAPATIGGYTSRNTGVATVSDYVSTDNTCELIVGTVTSTQLPGANLDAIVQPQIKQLKDAGATVAGPNAGTALVLKDSNNKTYSMPTLTFEFSQGKKHATVHYSAVILKSGDRAIVNRTCINANGTVDASRLNALNDIAKLVVVTPMDM
ncbi:MAG TPA: hypothetical protein VLH86_04635 [Patescibacteria group bacterium]|nr:hypothetical protein [Patescibacteria group bacterium]